MTTQEIATALVSLLRAGSFEEAQKTFLAEDAVSIEPNAFFFQKKQKDWLIFYRKAPISEQVLKR